MKTTIFDDKANSEKSIDRLNYNRTTDKRFFKIELLHKLVFQKTQKILSERTNSVEWVKTYIYTGEYNDKAMGMLKKSCGDTIREMNELIDKENQLLQKIHTLSENPDLKAQVRSHVTSVKERFEQHKRLKETALEKQTRNTEAQKNFFKKIREMNFVELKTTPLVCRNGYIIQKGVDVKLATDLIQLAFSNAYDVAVLMTGDLDLKESINLIREKLGKLVLILGYYSSNPDEAKYNTISRDLINSCDYFINTKDFTEQEIQAISTAKRVSKQN
ncbi:MAG TPA: NYN domain-containing protein [Candidatus Nanoarchaeia archaeon]|nr:NYN domain-containing protein [Candidatus Nanoarchaeia archaeon]